MSLKLFLSARLSDALTESLRGDFPVESTPILLVQSILEPTDSIDSADKSTDKSTLSLVFNVTDALILSCSVMPNECSGSDDKLCCLGYQCTKLEKKCKESLQGR